MRKFIGTIISTVICYFVLKFSFWLIFKIILWAFGFKGAFLPAMLTLFLAYSLYQSISTISNFLIHYSIMGSFLTAGPIISSIVFTVCTLIVGGSKIADICDITNIPDSRITVAILFCLYLMIVIIFKVWFFTIIYSRSGK